MERLLTAEEVAGILKLKRTTVYSLARKGIIPCIRISRRALRFKEKKILDWLEQGHNNDKKPKPEASDSKRRSGGSMPSVDSIISLAKQEVKKL